MEYSSGRPGRVFFIRFLHDEDVSAGLAAFCHHEGVHCGTIQLIGALLDGTMVCGPAEAVLPPEQSPVSFEGGWEVVGTGVILPGDRLPRIHLHASVGRGSQVLTGCLRAAPHAYILVEAVITEVVGVSASLETDPASGITLPRYPLTFVPNGPG